MNITTTYKTNANGRGQILAKGAGKQLTVSYDDARSMWQNHGEAAADLILKKFPEYREAALNSTHESSEDGCRHRFTL